MALAQTLDDLSAFARAGSFGALRTPRLVGFTLPARVTAGDALVVEWRTQNCTSVLFRAAGPEPMVRRLPASGRVEVVPQMAGTWEIALELRGESDIAHIAPKSVLVIGAPLAIHLSHALVTGGCGSLACVRWATEGALVSCVTRGGAKVDLPASGKLEVELGLLQEQLVFEAWAADGRRVQSLCQLLPTQNDILRGFQLGGRSIESEIALINQPLEMMQCTN